MIRLDGTARFEMAIKQYWEVEWGNLQDVVCREAPHYHLKLFPLETEQTFEMKGRILPWDAKDLLCKETKAIDLTKIAELVKHGLDFEADCVKRCCELEAKNLELKRRIKELESDEPIIR